MSDLLAFWCEVLGYVELERDEASIEIGPPGVGFGGPQPTIVFSTHKARPRANGPCASRSVVASLRRHGFRACRIAIVVSTMRLLITWFTVLSS